MNEERRTGDSVVRLKGALTIQRSGELREALLKSGERAARVIMEFEEFGGTDLSFLQMVCSAHREAARSGWSLQWGESVPGDFLKSAADYGFCRGLGCSHDKDGSCLWKALTGRDTQTTEQCAAPACAGRE